MDSEKQKVILVEHIKNLVLENQRLKKKLENSDATTIEKMKSDYSILLKAFADDQKKLDDCQMIIIHKEKEIQSLRQQVEELLNFTAKIKEVQAESTENTEKKNKPNQQASDSQASTNTTIGGPDSPYKVLQQEVYVLDQTQNKQGQIEINKVLVDPNLSTSTIFKIPPKKLEDFREKQKETIYTPPPNKNNNQNNVIVNNSNYNSNNNNNYNSNNQNNNSVPNINFNQEGSQNNSPRNPNRGVTRYVPYKNNNNNPIQGHPQPQFWNPVMRPTLYQNNIPFNHRSMTNLTPFTVNNSNY